MLGNITPYLNSDQWFREVQNLADRTTQKLNRPMKVLAS